MGSKYDYLKDEVVTKEVRYISFMGKFKRYDFAFIDDQHTNGKKVVIDLRKNRFAILGPEDFKKEGKIEHLFHVTEIEADELREFFEEVI